MTKIKKIAIYGAGGFGKEVASLLYKINEIESAWELIGFFDDGISKGMEIKGFGQTIGGLDTLNNWTEEINICFAVGNPHTLYKLVKAIRNNHIIYPNIIHPEAYFAHQKSFKSGRGNIVVRGCSFSCDVAIGDFNQFNSLSALAHDVKVGSFNVFMPLSRISGEVKIGDGNFFGIGSVILQRITIGNRTRIGAGSYIMRNTKDGYLYMGNPARRTEL